MESASPFYILPDDIRALAQSEPFQVLRNYLAVNATNSLCPEHAHCSPQAQSTWLLHRDMLHALVMPVVQLFHRASRLAEAALCSSKPEDLEMAFAGDARSAFLFLQCFLADEEAWCHSVGCPACIVHSTLSTEPHLRLLFTALNLANDSTSNTPSCSPSLPALPFFAAALRSALETDPFWASNPGTCPSIEASARKLTAHVRALMSQCAEIESLVADYSTSAITTSKPTSKTTHSRGRPLPGAEGKLPAVRAGRMAKRQQRMRQEEQALLQKLVAQCWGQAALAGAVPGARERAHIKALMRGQGHLNGFVLGNGSASGMGLERRRRSLTCP